MESLNKASPDLSSSVEQESQKEQPRHFNLLPQELRAVPKAPRRRLNIALVSDFFVPNLGGVEMHMYNVAQCLIEMGHKIIVITGSYAGERIGVRYLSNGLKVYYLPTVMLYSQTSHPPIIHVHMNIYRQIFIRE